MLSAPADLDAAALAEALAHWGLRDPLLEYLPVGFGSHHWRAETPDGRLLFVTVDDLAAGFQPGGNVDGAFAALERAYKTAAALRAQGLEFVLGPDPDGEGVLIRRVGARYAVSVAPFVEGTSGSFGAYESEEERRRLGELLGRLHVAGEGVPASLPLRDDLAVPSRHVLAGALGALDRPWGTGPFAEEVRALLAARADELESRLSAHDARAARVRERASSWVITHGEPHRANVLVTPSDGLRLVDWDTTRLAPRERDLWHVLDDELTGWDAYAAVAGDAVLDGEILALYREWWALADVASFVTVFRRPHAEDANTTATVEHLRSYLTTA